VRLQAAFLTGQSDPRGCALSPRQAAFLAALPLPAEAKVPLNFPYDRRTGPHRETALLAASWSNFRQFLGSWSGGFAVRYRPGVEAMLDGADRTLILAGSCGLELLARLGLDAARLSRIHVLAYGPAALRWPDCETTVVQGRRDWISRPLARRADAWVDCDHLGYLTCPEMLALGRDLVARLGA
jgi:hypothetical protein